MSGVPPTERHFILNEGNEPVVGNSDAMGIGAEIPKYQLGSAKRFFAVDNPAQRVELADQTPK